MAVLLPQLAATSLAKSDDVQMNATLRTGVVYPLGRWIPIDLRFTNRTSRDIDGSVQVDRIESLSGVVSLRRAVHLPAQSRVTLEMLVQLPEPPPPDKKGGSKPVLELLFKNDQEKTLVHEPIVALLDSADTRQGREATGLPGVLLLQASAIGSDIAGDEGVEQAETGDIASALSATLPFTIKSTTVEPAGLFRRVESYDACRIVAIDAAGLNVLDPAQRDALIRQIQGGATLIITDPSPDLQSTWIADLLPMDAVNQRRASVIDTREFGPLKSTRPVTTEYECVLRDDTTHGTVVAVATNDRGTVAAYRNVGLGRIVMTGFVSTAVNVEQPKVAALWMALLAPERTAFHDAEATLEPPALRNQLPSMIGVSAPPWRTAAIVVVAYVLTVTAVLTFSGARWRPTAFGVSALIAVLIAGAVVGLSTYNTRSSPLMSATVSVVDLSGDVARQDDLLALFGTDPGRGDRPSVTASPGTVLTPVVLADDAALSMFPIKLEDLSVSSGKLNTVLRAQSTGPAAATGLVQSAVSATLSFDANGAALNVSGLSAELDGPRIVTSAGTVLPLEPAASAAARRVAPRNPLDVWSAATSVLASEQSKLRDELVRSSEAPSGRAPNQMRVAEAQTAGMQLIGFADVVPGKGAGLITLSSVETQKHETLVRVPVTVAPAAPGSAVRIDPGLVRLRRDPATTSSPYIAETDRWNESSQSGTWLLALSAPSGLGKLLPKSVTLDVDLRGPGYVISVRRGQVNGGTVRPTPAGEAVLQWESTSGSRRVTFDVSPNDVDANGWVWLLVSADLGTSAASFDGVPPPWQVMRFDSQITGTVTGPDEPTRVTWVVEKPQPPAPKKPAASAKKPDPKKPPATKPATTKPAK